MPYLYGLFSILDPVSLMRKPPTRVIYFWITDKFREIEVND